MTSNLLCLNNQSINQSINHTINQSFIKYIRLTKRSPIYKRVLRLVYILIQLPSNNISIVFWRKGQVVRSCRLYILNPSKTEFIVIGLREQLKKIPDPSVSLNLDSASTQTFTPTSPVRNFGVIFLLKP